MFIMFVGIGSGGWVEVFVGCVFVVVYFFKCGSSYFVGLFRLLLMWYRLRRRYYGE